MLQVYGHNGSASATPEASLHLPTNGLARMAATPPHEWASPYGFNSAPRMGWPAWPNSAHEWASPYGYNSAHERAGPYGHNSAHEWASPYGYNSAPRMGWPEWPQHRPTIGLARMADKCQRVANAMRMQSKRTRHGLQK